MADTKGIALDPDRNSPAAEQIQVHQPPPDLAPGAIRQEWFARQQPLDGRMNLGSACAGLLPLLIRECRRRHQATAYY